MHEYASIVSGLPRSGTSMMMRMLEAGGMKVVVDNIRKADEDNPRGYYEFELVKDIRNDQSWLENLQGKVVKMVSMLLYDLPSNRRYKVIFMMRNISEILSSQRVMLDRKGEQGQSLEELALIYRKHLGEIEAWLKEQKNIEVLFVNYNEMLKSAHEIVPLINRFFSNTLNADAMVRVVDPSLYRQRGGQQGIEQAVSHEAASEIEGEKEKIESQLKSLGYM